MSDAKKRRKSFRRKRPCLRRLTLALATLFGCTPGAGEVQAPLPSPSAPLAAERTIVVRLDRVEVSGDESWKHERAGLLTALFESGFADLAGVVPLVADVEPSPGFARWMDADSSAWTASVEHHAQGERVTLALTLCGPEAVCATHQAEGARNDVTILVAELLEEAATVLHRAAPDEARTEWALPVSKDDYATLVTGRAAAVWYGLLPPPAAVKEGDRRRDPVARAVFLDPKIGLAQWILGRRALARGDAETAWAAFQRAREIRPRSIILRADEGAALLAMRYSEDAWHALEELEKRAPGDLRFIPLRAEVALARNRPAEALTILNAAPARFRYSRVWLELRVKLVDALGAPPSDYDELLARWQAAAPALPEPVRRRIDLRVKDGRHQEALELTTELANRGHEEEAMKLHLALSVALNALDAAARDAEALGQPALARRLAARAELEADPTRIPDALKDARDPTAALVRAEVLAMRGESKAAEAELDGLLSSSPWMPEALALKATVRSAAGDAVSAGQLWTRLRAADPRFSERMRAVKGPDALENTSSVIEASGGLPALSGFENEDTLMLSTPGARSPELAPLPVLDPAPMEESESDEVPPDDSELKGDNSMKPTSTAAPNGSSLPNSTP